MTRTGMSGECETREQGDTEDLYLPQDTRNRRVFKVGSGLMACTL